MSVKIRLKRMGSKKRPFYRIIATDSRNPRDGRFIETLGYYNPITEPADIHVKEDLVFKWMRHGAIPTTTAASLLRRTGTMKRWALLKQGVAESDLDAKYEELKSRETPPMSVEERGRIVAEKKAAAEAVQAKVEAEARAAEEAAAQASESKAEAEAPDAKPAAEAPEGDGSDENTK